MDVDLIRLPVRSQTPQHTVAAAAAAAADALFYHSVSFLPQPSSHAPLISQ